MSSYGRNSVIEIASRAEWALHRRTALAFEAAAAASLPGTFRTLATSSGLTAALATHPELGFLSTISGVTADTVSEAIELLWEFGRDSAVPAVVASPVFGEAEQTSLQAAGLVRVEDRVLAVREPRGRSGVAVADPGDGAECEAATCEAFASVLLAGYEAGGAVALYITEEHRHPSVRRYLAYEGAVPVGAAAMTVHEDVAVLGGASTLRPYRGRGIQSRLLRHRLRVAAELGCRLAVATASPSSPSTDNLRNAGFRIHHRFAWKPALV